MERLKQNPLLVSTSDHLFFGCATLCLAMAFLLVLLLIGSFRVHEIDRHTSPDNKYTLIVQQPGWMHEVKIKVEDEAGKTLHMIETEEENLILCQVEIKWMLEENTVVFKYGRGLNLQTGEITNSPLFEIPRPIVFSDPKYDIKHDLLEGFHNGQGYAYCNLKELKKMIGKRKYSTEPSWLFDIEKNGTQKKCLNEPTSADLKTFSVETGEHFIEIFPDFFIYTRSKSDWLHPHSHNVVVDTTGNNGVPYLQTRYLEEKMVNDYLSEHQPEKLGWSNEKYHCYHIFEESVLACVYDQGAFCYAKIYSAPSPHHSRPFLIEGFKKRVIAHTKASKNLK